MDQYASASTNDRKRYILLYFNYSLYLIDNVLENFTRYFFFFLLFWNGLYARLYKGLRRCNKMRRSMVIMWIYSSMKRASRFLPLYGEPQKNTLFCSELSPSYLLGDKTFLHMDIYYFKIEKIY